MEKGLLRGAQGLAKQMRWLLHRTGVAMVRVKRLALGGSTGSITASPSMVLVSDRFPYGVTTLSWTSVGAETVEVHVGTPDGPLFSRTGPSGSATTGKWVADGMVFYLQDVSGGKPLTLANTLEIGRASCRERV